MIALSTLPKNSRGIIKLVNITSYSKQELESIGLTAGTKIKVKHIIDNYITIETYFEDKKERTNIAVSEAFKILVLPI